MNRKVLFCSLTASLLIASATATLASDPADSNAAGSDVGVAKAAEGQANAAENQGNAAENQANAAENQANAAENQANAGNNNDPANGNVNAGGGGGQEAQQPGNDNGPPGNNGTIKIDGVDFDSHPNNEPHVDCIFEIDFYGFDANQAVTVSFALQAPTTGGTITGTSPSGMTLDDDDNSFGGSERGLDGSLRYTLGFTGVTPHPKQGYHVKVTIHAPGAKGADVKHKVFWVEPCGAPTPTTTPTTIATTPTTIASTPTTIATTTPTTVATTTPTTVATTPTTVGGNQQAQNQVSPTPVNTESRLAVLGEVIERNRAEVVSTQPGVVATVPAVAAVNAENTPRVLGTTVERAALARTGLDVLQLLTLGGIAVLAGLAAVRASRRKPARSHNFPT
ncbi:MAG TPA: hypothetical protein VNA57_11350 [Acidimicrobiales bacterium]|nr:hypothetical protein [Acidimicrobiales bacterium]